MNIELDFRSGIPIYLQVVERIRGMIAGGALKPGDQLPTVRAMAQELRVNFNTIARAYRILDESGIISTQQGRGTYIMEMPPPEAAASIRQKSLKALTARYLAEASRLGCSREDITEEFQEQMVAWRKTGSLTSSDNETKD